MRTTVQIPTRGDIANYFQRISLDNVPYILLFNYNARDSSWYLSLYDGSNNPILQGMKLVPNFSLTDQIQNPAWTGGVIITYDARPDPQPALLADLDGTVPLLYISAP
jgi:hypothetical protein